MTIIIIAGDADLNDYYFVREKLDELLRDRRNIKIMSGPGPGATQLGKQYAKERYLRVIKRKPRFQRRIPLMVSIFQNESRMAEEADELIIFENKASQEYPYLRREMEKRGKPVTVVRYYRSLFNTENTRYIE
jgi:hypothetical protein